ncbi:hypothetical protein BGY98DRAFT_942826 [Russula aff. rugulosa BPL654]|nr:hypothetical protein BGY98DRAFT_942826 [Russula aff. rugulosa BPL654]
MSLRLEDQHRSFTPWRPPTRLSGRGGAGNIHTTITPRERTSSSTSDSIDNSSLMSFRKLRLASLPRTGNTKPRSKSLHKAASFGRGGAGNCRERKEADSKSPPLPDITHLEQQYLRARDAWRPHQPQSSGRGGAGNISLPRPIARAVQIFVSVTKR